mgnify:CR=1 FL=1
MAQLDLNRLKLHNEGPHHMWEEEVTFQDLMADRLKQAPWLILSAALHAVVGLALYVGGASVPVWEKQVGVPSGTLVVEGIPVTTTTAFTSSHPASIARSRPRRLSTSPMNEAACIGSPAGRAPRRAARPAMTSGASAICGTRWGFTNEVVSIRCTPDRTMRSINSSLASVATINPSL